MMPSTKRFFAGVLIALMFLVSSPLVVQGEGGNNGGDGTAGVEGAAGQTIPVLSSNDLVGAATQAGETGTDAEEVTGGQATSSVVDITIVTGDASAGGELFTDVNSNDIQSPFSTSTQQELDTYSLTATGTNEAIVDNQGTTTAVTGENLAESTGNVFIETGDAISVLNIANIVNTTVINSVGLMQLLNRLIEGTLDLDLQELFFPGGLTALEDANNCSFLSCASEDVVYNILNTNNATITNNANIDAISGVNSGIGDVVSISTGDTFGAANLINIANTNIIDSNYRLVAVNGLGTLNGDLVLPSEALFRTFFGLPNGVNQAQNDGVVFLNDNNVNVAGVNNNLNTFAETGSNNATMSLGGLTQTGNGYADSNIVNQVNKNLFGGDSLFMHIRVHGSWNGTVYGLPAGLSWIDTADGIIIYNTDAEIVPSEILQYDIDSYTANFNNNNTVAIDNNININSISGENNLDGTAGIINTGDSYAGANVINIANTNVVGRNWIMAIFNIFGDFNGNVSFGRPDLWIGGQVQSTDAPAGPGSLLTYTYTIKNNGNLKSTNVNLSHVFDGAHIRYDADGEQRESDNRQESIGTLLPGETRVISFDAYVDGDVPVGDSNVRVTAQLTQIESDSNRDNNREELDVQVRRPHQGGGGGGYSQGSYYGQGSYGGGTGTTTGTTTPPVYAQGSYYAQSNYYAQGAYSQGGGGGGGGGGGSSKPTGKVLGSATSPVVSNVSKIDPNKAALLTLKKTADTNKSRVVKAGQEVNYTVTVNNAGGQAYNAKLFDRLVNPIGAVVSEQSWDLGTIKAGESIKLQYSVIYKKDTPSGFYTNTASVEAYRKPNDLKTKINIKDAVHILKVAGVGLSIGNVGVHTFFPSSNGQSSALITWETSKLADGQVFLSPQGVVSPFNALLAQYGYQRASYRTSALSTLHYVIIPGLQNGAMYTYRLRSVNPTHATFGGDYTFTVPGVPATAAALTPLYKSMPTVAGTAIVALTPKPAGAVPTPVVVPVKSPVVGGVVNQVKNKVFNFFR